MAGATGSAELNGLEQFAVATGERSPEVLRVLKEGDSFAVFDQRGDVVPDLAAEAGFYHGGTRFISRWELLLYSGRPLRLSSSRTTRRLPSAVRCKATRPSRCGRRYSMPINGNSAALDTSVGLPPPSGIRDTPAAWAT